MPPAVPHIAAPNGVAHHGEAPHVGPPGPAMVTPNVAPPYLTSPRALPGGPGNRDAAGSLQSLFPSRNGGPILRNPAYANIAAGDPADRALARSKFGGRFAQARFVPEADRHRRPFGRVIGFLGPVFWPYGYDDFIDYTFSPYAYDTFWPVAFDDVFDGIYGAYGPAYSNYVSDSDDDAGGTAYVYGNETGAWVTSRGRSSRAARLAGGAGGAGGATQICSGQTEGLAQYPIGRIAQQVQPNGDQQDLLDDLKAVTAEALETLRAACPSDLPSTPTGRLDAMRSRVEAMLQAVRAIEPALQQFYQSLSDEQKERFNALDTQNTGTGENQKPDAAQLCSAGAQRTNPRTNPSTIALIDQVLRLSDAQETTLNALQEASVKAGDILKESCPNELILTPTARLAQMKRRLEAMMGMLDTVRPTLLIFYGSLDDEQKARFNRFGARPF
jgi:hypothetical protein